MNQNETINIQANNGLTVRWLNVKTGEVQTRMSLDCPGRNWTLQGAFVDGVLNARATRKAEEQEEFSVQFAIIDFLGWVGNYKFHVLFLVAFAFVLYTIVR